MTTPSTALRRLQARLGNAESALTKLNLTFVLPSALEDVEQLATTAERDAARSLAKGFGSRCDHRLRAIEARVERRLVQAFLVDAVQRLRPVPKPSDHLQAELCHLATSEPNSNAGRFAAQALRNPS